MNNEYKGSLWLVRKEKGILNYYLNFLKISFIMSDTAPWNLSQDVGNIWTLGLLKTWNFFLGLFTLNFLYKNFKNIVNMQYLQHSFYKDSKNIAHLYSKLLYKFAIFLEYFVKTMYISKLLKNGRWAKKIIDFYRKLLDKLDGKWIKKWAMSQKTSSPILAENCWILAWPGNWGLFGTILLFWKFREVSLFIITALKFVYK